MAEQDGESSPTLVVVYHIGYGYHANGFTYAVLGNNEKN